MVRKHLGVKTKPFAPEEWGSVVREGAKILNENHWFPAATIIIGWPDETPDDNQHTIDMMSDFREMYHQVGFTRSRAKRNEGHHIAFV